MLIKDPNLKGSPPYISPEVYLNLEYSKSSDVYAFGIIAFEIMMNEKAFKNFDKNEIKKSVTEKGQRPKFNEIVPSCYRQLIEKCWSQDPSLRPSFDEISNELKTNSNFITEKVNKDEFLKYVQYIDEYPTSFDSSKKITHLEEQIELKTNTFKKEVELSKNVTETDSNLDIKKYIFLRKVGTDGFYKFYKVQNVDDNKKQFMAKKPYSKIENFFMNEIINISREMNIILQVNHPSVVKTIGYSPVNTKNLPYPVIVTEKYSPLIKTLEIVRTKGEYNNWDDTLKLINIYGIAAAMAYLHSHNIIHRDLKPSNIFLDENQFPKLSGFNLSQEIEEYEEFETMIDKYNIVGTPAYLAPEIYKYEGYSKSSDVYSYSLIIYEIITI